MNKDIPQGPSEVITNGTVTRKTLVMFAETDCVITDLLFQPEFIATPPNDDAVDAFTLVAGRYLFNIAEVTFNGTATFIYRY